MVLVEWAFSKRKRVHCENMDFSILLHRYVYADFPITAEFSITADIFIVTFCFIRTDFPY